jgi:hypothetical protein
VSFLHPWFLLGALGAAVPVLLHLFGRRRARRLPFSSLMLIQQAQRERSALMRVRQLLLMLLRALMILLLSLALAQPKLSWLHVRPETVIVACDDSASMQAKSAAWDVPGTVSAAAEQMEARRREVVSLSTLAALPAAAAPSEPGFMSLDVRAQLARLQEQHAGDSGTVVTVLSDLQRSTWGSAARLAEDGPPTSIVDCGHEMRNAAVLGVELAEPRALLGRPTLIAATVSALQATTVRLLADGQEVAAAIAPGGPEPARLLLEWTPRQAGARKLTVALPPDDLAADNVGYLAVGVRERLRVLVVGAGLPARLAALALAPGAESGVAAQVATTLPATLDQDALIATAWPAQAEVARLRQAVEGGLGLVVFAGDAPAEALQGLFGEEGPRAGRGASGQRPVEGALKLGDFDVFRPPLQSFANPAAGDLAAAEFKSVRPLTIPPGAPWRVLARFEEGTPALVEGRVGRGRVLISALPLDPKQTDLPRQPVFVPLMHRLAGYVARDTDDVLPSVLVGERVASPHAAGQAGVPAPPMQPGFHTLPTPDGQRQWLFAANVDPAETDLTRIEPAELQRQLRLPVTSARSPRPLGLPLALTLPLLVALLLLALAEMLLTHPVRLSRRPRGMP